VPDVAGLRPFGEAHLDEDLLQPGAPLDQRHMAQVQAVVVHQVEQVVGDVLGRRVVEPGLEGAEVGRPCSLRMMISPSSQHGASFIAAMSRTKCGSFFVQSWPLRVKSRNPAPSTRASIRQPSN
jgi:hypothetical protein